MADAIETTIMEMLTRSYPSGLTAKDILRRLKDEGAMKAAVSYLGDAFKFICGSDKSLPGGLHI